MRKSKWSTNCSTNVSNLQITHEMMSDQLCYGDFLTIKIPKIKVDYCHFNWLLQKIHNRFDFTTFNLPYLMVNKILKFIL